MDTILFVIVFLFIVISSLILILEEINRKRELNRAFALLSKSKKLEEQLYSLRSKGYLTNSSQNIEESSTEYIHACNMLLSQIFELKLEAEFLLQKHSVNNDTYNENENQ